MGNGQIDKRLAALEATRQTPAVGDHPAIGGAAWCEWAAERLQELTELDPRWPALMAIFAKARQRRDRAERNQKEATSEPE